jgi:hypothetical protein
MIKSASVKVAGLWHKTITDPPTKPGEPAYLHATLHLQRKGSEYEWGSAHWVDIVIDCVHDKWAYVSEASIQCWPPRYKITVDMRNKIFQAAAELNSDD